MSLSEPPVELEALPDGHTVATAEATTRGIAASPCSAARSTLASRAAHSPQQLTHAWHIVWHPCLTSSLPLRLLEQVRVGISQLLDQRLELTETTTRSKACEELLHRKHTFSSKLVEWLSTSGVTVLARRARRPATTRHRPSRVDTLAHAPE